MNEQNELKRYELVHLTQGWEQDDHELQESPEGECVAYSEAKEAIEAKDALISELREALNKYGQHDEICDGYFRAEYPMGECTCGLDEVLAAKERG